MTQIALSGSQRVAPALCRESGSQLHELSGFSLRGGPQGSGQRRSLAGRAPACPQVTVSGPGQGAKGSRNEKERKEEKKGVKGWGEGRKERKPLESVAFHLRLCRGFIMHVQTQTWPRYPCRYPPAEKGDLFPAPGPWAGHASHPGLV